MQSKIEKLMAKKRELEQRILEGEQKIKNIKATAQKLSSQYYIGEIDYATYQQKHKEHFQDKSPSQLVSDLEIHLRSYRAQLSWHEKEIRKTEKTDKKIIVKNIETNASGLLERIKAAEQHKQKVISTVQNLAAQYSNKEISYQEYNQQIREKFKDKTPQEWSDYYDSYIKNCQSNLEAHENRLKKVKIKAISFKAILPILLVSILVITSFLFLSQRGEITGKTIEVIEETHADKINEQFDETTEYSWKIENPGKLNWVKISGEIKGKGTAKIYLDDYLLFESKESPETITGRTITGFNTEGAESSDDSDSGGDSSSSDSSEPSASESSDTPEEEESSDSAQDTPAEETPEEEEKTPSTETEEQTQEPPSQEQDNETSLQPEETTNETNEEPPAEEKTQTFSDICEETCDLADKELNKTSYTLRIELTNSKLKIKEINYNVEIEKTAEETPAENITLPETNFSLPGNETYLNETNLTVPPIILKEIPSLEIEKNTEYLLNVSEYISNAEQYFLLQTENIATSSFDHTVKLIPEENFTGNRTSQIIATNSFGTTESNLFAIYVLDSNQTTNITEIPSNASVNITTQQYKAIINRPVKWLTTVNVENANAIEELEVKLPKDAENISIKTGEEVNEAIDDLENYGEEVETAEKEEIISGSITGNVARDTSASRGIITRLIEWISKRSITGNVIEEQDLQNEITQTDQNTLVDINSILEQTNESEIAIEYFTEAPIATESPTSTGKIITVSAPDELNYTDILAYTLIEQTTKINSGSLQLTWYASYEDAVIYGFISPINKTKISKTEENAKIIITEKENINETIQENQNDTITASPEETTNETERTTTLTGSSITGFAIEETESVTEEANISKNLSLEKLPAYVTINFPFTEYDLNNDSFVDYIEWAVPHLSNQTFTLTVSNVTSIQQNVTTDNNFTHLTVDTSVSPYTNLVAYYSFDADNENTPTTTHYDFAINNSDGTGVGNTAVNNTNCAYDKCAHFDGVGDYITLTGSETILDYGDDQSYTWSFWIKPNSLGSQGIFGKGDAYNPVGYEVVLDEGSISLLDMSGPVMTANTPLTTGVWQHVVVVYRGPNAQADIYVNNVSNGTNLDNGAGAMWADIGSALTIGISANYGAFSGSIDEVMLFNTNISRADISAIYSNSSRRFKSAGTIELKQFNISVGQNTMNLSFQNYRRFGGTNISAKVGYWDKTKSYNHSDFSGYANLTNYWHMNETSWGTPIDSVGALSLTAVGNSNVSSTNYPFDGAATFDGSGDYITDGSNVGILNGLNSGTFSAWIKRNGASLYGYETVVREGAALGYELTANCNNSRIQFGVRNSTTGYLGTTFSNSLINDSNWHHLAGVYDGDANKVYLYVDGQLINSSNADITITNPAIGIGIAGHTQNNACDNSASDPSFNGSIDEVMIFKRSLSQPEIQELYVKGRALWAYTNYQSISSMDSNNNLSTNTFSIDSITTNIQPTVIINSDTNNFYTPFFTATATVPSTLRSFDLQAPSINFTSPTPASGFLQNSNAVYVNISSSDTGGDHYTLTKMDNDILLWMRMDDVNASGSPTDISSYSNNGTKGGNAAQTSAGYYAQGFSFDGADDYISLGNLAGLKTATKTISFWAKPNAISSAIDVVFGNGGSNYYVSFVNSGGNNYLLISYSNASSNQKTQTSSAGLAVLGEWHMYTVTFDISGNNVNTSYYKDGNYDESDVYTGGYGSSYGSNFYIGAITSTANEYNGTLDELIIFNRTLSSSEIKALYNATANQYYANLTSLTNGAHNLTGYTVDRDGNRNQTETRQVIVDIVNPSVNFTGQTPASGSVQSTSSIYVNVSSNDTNSVYSFANFDNDLLLWMRMDDVNASGDPTDLSSYSNNGSKVGNAIQTTAGYYGKGFSLNGNGDYIDLGMPAALNFSGNPNFTISTWVYSNGLGDYDGIIGDSAGGTSSTVRFSLGAYSPPTRAYLAWGNGTDTNGYISAANSLAQNNTWYHVAIAVNSTNIIFYINGISSGGAQTLYKSLAAPTVSWKIGRVFNSASYDWNGTIDEVLIFNRTLSAAEIASIYNASANQYYNNFTSLTSGVHTFTGYAVDKAGNKNQTEQRTVTIDTAIPAVSFVSPTPANGFSQSNSEIYVNISSSDPNGHYTFVDFDRSNLLWLRMDDTNSTGDPTDLSSYSNNGSKQGTAAQITNGYFGKGFNFDGDSDYIRTNTVSPFNASKPFTVSAWISRTGATVGTIGGIVGYTDITSNYDGFSAIVYDNDLKPRCIGYPGTGTSSTDATASSAISNNQWYLVSCVYNGTTLLTYVNGTLQSSTAIVSISNTELSDENIVVGKYFSASSSAQYYWNGSIDEVLVFNRSLSSTEISALYSATSTQYQNNFTSLSGGAHNFTGYAVDKAGNKNQTEQRTVTIDTTAPAINFTSPTPVNNTYVNSVYINISSSDLNQHYTFTKLDSDLLLWMRMDDINASGDPTDLSSYSNNGSKVGNAVQNSSGYYGSGFSFDGDNDYITVNDNGDSLDFYSTGNYTWSFWINRRWSFTGVMGKYADDCYEDSGYIIALGDDPVLSFVNCNNASDSITSDWINENQWYYVTIVYSPANTSIYLNGVLNASRRMAFTKNDTTSPLLIGASLGAETFSLSGSIDEVLIFNRTLSATEILSLYNSTATQYQNSFTSLPQGAHSFTGYAVDKFGNRNETETRQITLDSIPPAINFTGETPTNGSSLSTNSIYLNVTSSDTNDHYTLVDFDRDVFLWLSMEQVSGTTVVDSSSYSNNGTSGGSVAQIDPGYFGKGAYFAGGPTARRGASDQIAVSSLDSKANGASPFSISGWIKTTTTGRPIIGDWYTDLMGSAHYGWEARVENNNLTLYIGDGTIAKSNFSGNSSVINNNWHFFTATYNSTDFKIYVDGNFENSKTKSSATSASQKLLLGNTYDGSVGGADDFNGTMDEIIFFNRTLSATEIKSLYNASANKYYNNFTNLPNGNHTFTGYAVDRATNRNQTEQRTITILGDTTAPSITIISPLNNSNFNSNSITFNVSLNENASWCGLSINGKTNVSMTLNSSLTGANYTNSSITDGNYNFVVSCNDTSGNLGNSNTNYFLVDTINPQINFTGQTSGDGSSQSNAEIYVNISSSDSNDHYTFADFDRSLVLWMRMDDVNGSGSPTDISSYSNNGSKQGTAVQTTAGYFGKGFSFDGTGDYITTTYDPQFNYTLSMWFKTDNCRQMAMAGGTNYFTSIAAMSSNGRILTRQAENNYRYSTGTYCGNTWNHLVIISRYNSSNTDIYVNGILDNAAAYAVDVPLAVYTDFQIGVVNGWFGDWNGTIDEVMVFNRTLSQQEILSLYNASANKYYNNFTSLADGAHNFTGYAVDKAGNRNQTEQRTVTVTSNAAPTVPFVSAIANTDPIENSIKSVTFVATASDTNGISDISSLNATFSRTGQTSRTNSSCSAISGQNTSTTQNYSCTIDMWYFDENGNWNITVIAEDASGEIGTNSSTTFQYNLLKAMVLSPNALTFSVQVGAENQTATNDPTLINNTGNYDVANISITATNLVGETYPEYYISVENISVGINTGGSPPAECNGTTLLNSTAVNITSAVLNRGNNSVNDGSTGQEQLYYCIKSAQSLLPTQTYSTTAGGSWTITILSAFFVRTQKKRKKKNGARELIEKKLKNKISLTELALLEETLKTEYQTTISETIVDISAQKEEITIPLQIFAQELSPAEAVCKYLKENKKLSYHKIALLLNRDDRTIWINYRNAYAKKNTVLRISRKSMAIPINIFENRNLSILESLVNHLQEKGFRNTEIAKLLNKDPRNIWTLRLRYLRKQALEKRNV